MLTGEQAMLLIGIIYAVGFGPAWIIGAWKMDTITNRSGVFPATSEERGVRGFFVALLWPAVLLTFVVHMLGLAVGRMVEDHEGN